MKNQTKFTLVFRTVADDELEKNIRSGIKQHLDGLTCSNCMLPDLCPVKNFEKCPVKNLGAGIEFGIGGIASHDDIVVITEMINTLYPAKIISFMFLIDEQKDIGYLYKGEGTMAKIRKEVLPRALKVYEAKRGISPCFSEIRDVRDTMRIPNPSMN